MSKIMRLALIVMLLAGASLACNLPYKIPGPFPTATTAAEGTQGSTAVLPATQVDQPTFSPLSATAPPTVTALSDGATSIPSATVTNTATPTLPVSGSSPTAPPTITPRPTTPTPIRTATIRTPTAVVGSNRLRFTASYFSTAPLLDGLWDEWTSRSTAYPARFVTYGAANWTGSEDLDGSFRAAWDANNLYLAVKAIDDVYAQGARGSNLYQGDSLELLLDTNLSGDLTLRQLDGDDFQLGVSPGNPDVQGMREAFLWFPREKAGSREQVRIASVRQDTVTRYEIAIPWSLLGVVPGSGARYGFALSVSDNDDPDKNDQQSLISSVPGRVLVDPTTWGELLLK